MPPRLIRQIIALEDRQVAAVAFLRSGTALKAVQNGKEILLIIETYLIFDFSAVLEYLYSLLELDHEVGGLHLLLFILLELKSLQVQSFVEVFGRHFVPVFICVDILNSFQLVDLESDLVPEYLACLQIIRT